jgi:hypothetical protein
MMAAHGGSEATIQETMGLSAPGLFPMSPAWSHPLPPDVTPRSSLTGSTMGMSQVGHRQCLSGTRLCLHVAWGGLAFCWTYPLTTPGQSSPADMQCAIELLDCMHHVLWPVGSCLAELMV